MRTLFVVSALAVGLLAAPAMRAQANDRYVVPLSHPGQPVRLIVDLVSGSITVDRHDGNDVVIESAGAEVDSRHERGHRSAPNAANGMRRLPNRSMGLVVEEENNKVTVEMNGVPSEAALRILVPRQTSVKLSTVNDGDIRVEGVDGTLELDNTNGGIVAKDVSGSVVAHTTNGDVQVVMKSVDPKAALAFSTFNGNVDVTLPAALHGDVRMRSDNGEIFTDFEMQMSSQPAKVEQKRAGGRYRLEIEQEVRGTVGGGGAEIQLRTFNGNIYLRKRDR